MRLSAAREDELHRQFHGTWPVDLVEADSNRRLSGRSLSAVILRRTVLRNAKPGHYSSLGKTSVTIRSPSLIEPPHFSDFNHARAESRDEYSWLSGGVAADGRIAVSAEVGRCKKPSWARASMQGQRPAGHRGCSERSSWLMRRSKFFTARPLSMDVLQALDREALAVRRGINNAAIDAQDAKKAAIAYSVYFCTGDRPGAVFVDPR